MFNSFATNIKEELKTLENNLYTWRQDDVKRIEKLINESVEKTSK